MEEANTSTDDSSSVRSTFKGVHIVPHLSDLLSCIATVRNPLCENRFFHPTEGFFVSDHDLVARHIAVDSRDLGTQSYFLRAGPREQLLFDPADVKAAIVTCGGLCPGINTVVRELVTTLWDLYNVRSIQGIMAGYRGFIESKPIPLDPHKVDAWHKKGGSILGTSRGGFDGTKIVDQIEHYGFNLVFVIGGDGTMRGALQLFQEIRVRKLKVSIVGIPKTVDNDIPIIDRSFGFQTAVEESLRAIDAAHVEAESTPNGIGVVKLMGRNAGHIAASASLSSRDVDCCLIPEVPFFLEGAGGLLEFVDICLHKSGHCVIVVAEGAGQELIPRSDEDGSNATDASGNKVLLDVGHWLCDELKRWRKTTYPTEIFAVKYIDPTYMVRAVPSNSADTLFCSLLAQSAVHGSMAGYTGFVVGPVNGIYSFLPMDQVCLTSHKVDINNHVWAWMRSSNNQPDFYHHPVLNADANCNKCLKTNFGIDMPRKSVTLKL